MIAQMSKYHLELEANTALHIDVNGCKVSEAGYFFSTRSLRFVLG